jgi:hypothetical protein
MLTEHLKNTDKKYKQIALVLFCCIFLGFLMYAFKFHSAWFSKHFTQILAIKFGFKAIKWIVLITIFWIGKTHFGTKSKP